MELTKADTATIKGIAILLMLWHHLFLNTMAYGAFAHSLAVVFKVCVALFLFVSGYGLTKQYSKLGKPWLKNTLKFLLRRYINFFLSYWFCFVLVVLAGNLFGFTFQDAYPASRNTLKCVILDVFGQMGYDSYLHPWWFNKMIIQLYLVFPVLFLALRNKYATVAVLVAIVVLQLFANHVPGKVFFIIEGGLPAFFLGMMTAQYQFVPELKGKKWSILLFAASLLLCVCLCVVHLFLVKDPFVAIMVRAMMAFCIIVVYRSIGRRHVSVLGLVGKYATIMYLTHILFVKLIPGVIYGAKYAVLIFVVFVAVCLVTAMLIDGLEKLSRYNKLNVLLVKQIDKW